mmetsp:Transcript_93713/g.201116  ORF Transcript_93713/g.201116 Transcript_93713/m.201116 type:complete len:310 (+) Transcript_93713:60-989(+)
MRREAGVAPGGPEFPESAPESVTYSYPRNPSNGWFAFRLGFMAPVVGDRLMQEEEEEGEGQEEDDEETETENENHDEWQEDEGVDAVPAGGPGMGEAEGQAMGDASTEEEIQEALQREQADVQEALLRSKAEPKSKDGVLVTRLSFHSPNIMVRIRESLAELVERVLEAGCDVQPEWAHGAVLLVPLTEMQLREAEIALKAHNIVVLERDLGHVQEVLRGLPRRRRPQLKPECHDQEGMQTGNGSSPDDAYLGSAEPCDVPYPELVVENSFLSYPMAALREVSETSTVVNSDPGAGTAGCSHQNPRRWA